jgi:maltokinase
VNGAAGESAEVVRRLIESEVSAPPVTGVERQVSTDQANLSVAVDDRYIVKWFHDPLDRRALTVLEQLSASDFAHMPRFIGSIGEGGRVVATVSELVEGATDGWRWYVDDVLAWLDGSLALDHLVDTAAQMGAITAELHGVLATDPAVLGSFDPSRDWVADRRRVAVEQTTGPPGDRLRARIGQIDAALAVLDSIDVVPVQRVHGDLHAGQFLRAGDRLLLTDFDGDPLDAVAGRVDLLPVERDVAALLQSLDHIGRIAAKRRPGADVEPFIEPAIAAATDAYRASRPLDDRLTFALRVAQELHEYAYAATRLPIWTYVPDEATQALFPNEDGADE